MTGSTQTGDDAILQALFDGNRVLAMKLYRETYGGSLTDAKTFIDDLLRPSEKAAVVQFTPRKHRMDHTRNNLSGVDAPEALAGSAPSPPQRPAPVADGRVGTTQCPRCGSAEAGVYRDSSGSINIRAIEIRCPACGWSGGLAL